MKPSWQAAKDFLTLLIALVGAVLGVINTLTARKEKRVKLVAKAKYAHMVSHMGDFGPQMGCIEVTNLSQFSVFVSEIGFEVIGNNRRFAVTQPITTDHLPFARKLESRQSVTGYFDLPTSSFGVAGRCSVSSQSGERFWWQ